MKLSVNKPGVLTSYTVHIILILHLFFILESIQQRSQRKISSKQLFQQIHDSTDGLYCFYNYDYKLFPKRPSRVLISDWRGYDTGKRNGIKSIKNKDSMTRILKQNREKRSVYKAVNNTEEVTDKTEEPVEPETEFDEPVDPETASDELEIERGFAVNFNTRFENRSPLSKFVFKNCGKSKTLGKRIVNGADAEEGVYPWTVAILKYGDAWCGGAILNRWWIVTASHCFMSLMDTKAYVARVGSVDRNAGTSYKIKKLIMHERFHLDNMFNSDIALLKVDRPIIFTKNVNSVCFPTTPFEEPKTTTMIVVGWGAYKSGDPDMPVNLQEVTLDRISDGNCARRYQAKSNTIYKSQICTYTEKKDACQGDSGGPAIEIQNSRAVLIGIVSYGSKCADEFPGVYTQVSYFLNWIKTQLEKDKKS